MRKDPSSSHEGSDPALNDGAVEADFAEFRALCDRIAHEKQIPTTPNGMPNTSEAILDVLREACARTVAARPGADHPKASDISSEEFLAIRKAAGLKIDARSAEVTWCYAYTLDPYGIYELPEECRQAGREYFARASASDIWVWFGDLPQETREALWEAHKHKLAFPAGLPLGLLRRHANDNGNLASCDPKGFREEVFGTGIEAFGKNPRSPAGRHFGLSIRAWIPLAAYCATLSHDLNIDWHAKDGVRLTNDQAAALAAVLQTEIDSGDTAEYERRREIKVRGVRNEDCRVYAHKYCIFATEMVAEFARFLQDCGGSWIRY